MNRDQFCRMSNTVLRQQGIPNPEHYTEALAAAMDLIALTLGDAPPTAAPPPPPRDVPRAAFPAPNPEAIAPVHPVDEQDALPVQGLIIPATHIPDADELGKMKGPGPPARSLRPSQRMKVEDLSRLIQERTPANLPFDVPMEDGSTRRVTFVRNVISMHAFDSVQLIYSPPNVLPSAREACEVQEVLNVDDIPLDLPAIMKRLTEQAINAVRPRRPVVSVTPAPTSGPVKHSADTYQDGGATQVLGVFNSMG